MDNGSEPKKSVVSEVLDVISDHAELLSLEWRYESQQAVRRLSVVGAALILGIMAFVLIQVALICALMAAGLKVGWASLILAVIYLAVAGIIWPVFGKRDARAGQPFEGTRRQLPESMQWIQKLFS